MPENVLIYFKNDTSLELQFQIKIKIYYSALLRLENYVIHPSCYPSYLIFINIECLMYAWCSMHSAEKTKNFEKAQSLFTDL